MKLIEHHVEDGWREWEVQPADVSLEELIDTMTNYMPDFVGLGGRIYATINKDGNVALFVGLDTRR